MEHTMAEYKWLDMAVSGIRSRADREAVRAELLAHLEDKTADLQRVFPQIPLSEAQERALAGMGDPEEVRRELARVHRPWLGWLWRASQVLAAVTLVLAFVLYGGDGLRDWTRGLEQDSEWNRIEDCYQSGIDPWQGDGADRDDGVIRTPLAALQPEDSVRVGDYRFRIKRAGLFCFQDAEQEPGEWWLFAQLRAAGPPWAPASENVIQRLRAVDSTGREYASSYEVYSLRLEHEGYVMVDQGRGNWLEKRFDLTVIGIAPGAEWIKLEYDWMGTQWSLTIPLVVEEGGTNG
ncbi:hypothetical protein D7V91_03900 [bacterium 1xD42-67]|nr:hypothetical protein D7V91_03900 [bacterium 1xD42-67]